MKIGIGIDTGGTYTDSVVYDFSTNSVLASAKALTTKDDLSIGILNALDGIPGELLRQADIIALSTTLATNACIEDKGGNARLVFFGGDPRVLDEFGQAFGLPPTKEIHIQESYTKFSGAIEREPDWALFERSIAQDDALYDSVGIVELYAMRNGAVVEKKAKALLAAQRDLPVVCGHELFSELSCLQRASSALLNARLLPVIQEFLDAIHRSVAQRGIQAALVIVRSDGSMMNETFASARPVETLLCGPAASAIGGQMLCQEPNCMVIDMGGTTTDIAMVRDNVPVTVVEGVSIGKWKTLVNGLYIKTFGLGGDSAIHYDGKRAYLEEYRVVPLCVAASKHPVILDNLRALNKKKRHHTLFLFEHLLLIKDIGNAARYSDAEKALCKALKAGPLTLWDAAAAIGTDMYNLPIKKLIKDGIVQLCGLTPTDAMHIKGDFTQYATEASLLGMQFAAYNLETSVQALCDWVYGEVKRKIYLNVVRMMLESSNPQYRQRGVGRELEAFINLSYENARLGKPDPLIQLSFGTQFSLVGLGAPIQIFLEDVAAMLHTKAVIPRHFEVANALGAIAGNISATHSVEIRPINTVIGVSGYTVFGEDCSSVFKEIADAEAFAIHQAEEGARNKAVSRGARGAISVTSSVHTNQASAKDACIYLGTTVTARAVGGLGF